MVRSRELSNQMDSARFFDEEFLEVLGGLIFSVAELSSLPIMKHSLVVVLVVTLAALTAGAGFSVQNTPLPRPVLEVAAENTHWITTKSGVRHNKTCRWHKTSKGRACGPSEGWACKKCGG